MTIRSRPAPWRAAALALGAAGALVAVPAATADEADRWKIDESHFAISFLVDHIGFADTLGMFLEAEGEFVYDPETMELHEGEVRIDTASVFSNHEERDEHVRDDDFLDVEQYPQMVFTAREFRPADDADPDERVYGKLVGDLELLGVSREVVLDVEVNRIAEYPFGGGVFRDPPYVLGASLRATIQRSEWGMDYAVDDGTVGDDVELILEIEAQRQ